MATGALQFMLLLQRIALTLLVFVYDLSNYRLLTLCSVKYIYIDIYECIYAGTFYIYINLYRYREFDVSGSEKGELKLDF